MKDAFTLGWGKVRRFLLVSIRPGKVERKLQLRRGSCSRCGTSCKLLFQCPALDESDGETRCLIYNDRPGVCGLFPLDTQDLAERDIVNPSVPCGYNFVEERTSISPEDHRRLYSDRRSIRGTLNLIRYFTLGLGKPDPSGKGRR
jgi:hypothetical protein